jgi:hypothetical protein
MVHVSRLHKQPTGWRDKAPLDAMGQKTSGGYGGPYITATAPHAATPATRGGTATVTTPPPTPPTPRRILPDTPRAWPRGDVHEITYILGDLGLSIARFISWIVTAIARLLFTFLRLAARGIGWVAGKISRNHLTQRAGEIIGWVVVVVALVVTVASLGVTRTWIADHWPLAASNAQHTTVQTGPCQQARSVCVAPTRDLDGAPSISATKILSVLQSYSSPAANSLFADQLYDLGVKYGINPAYALGFFAYESQCGTTGIAVNTLSLGNVRYSQSTSPVPYGDYMDFRKYSSWRDGAEDWFWVIRTYYINQGLRDIYAVTPVYAPSSDNNNPQQYAQTVYQLVQTWNA